MNIIKLKIVNYKVLNLINIEIINNFSSILSSILFFFISNFFIYFFSGKFNLNYDLNIHTLLCSAISFMSSIKLIDSFIKGRDTDNFNKRLKTLPINSDYIYFSLLILLYLNLLVFSLLSVIFYLMFFKGAGLFIFIFDLIGIQFIIVVLVTIVFIVYINRLMLIATIIISSFLIMVFLFKSTISMKIVIQLSQIIQTNKFSYFFAFLFITILLVIVGTFIYRKRQYSEV